MKKDKKFSGLLASVTEANKRFSFKDHPHHNDCRLYDWNTLKVQDIDRKWRKEAATNSLMNPHEAYENGFKEALEASKAIGESGKEAGSIRVKYPAYSKVNNQYHRRRRMANFSVPDPYHPPAAFLKTHRAFVMEDEEKFVSRS